MTPTILLYILDGLDDLTTVLFSHYFIIDHCAPLPMRSIGPLGNARGEYTWSMLSTIMCSPLQGKDTADDPRNFLELFRWSRW